MSRVMNIKKLQTISNWAKAQGITTQATYQFFNPENTQHRALALRKEWEVIVIDGIKFIAKKKGGKK